MFREDLQEYKYSFKFIWIKKGNYPNNRGPRRPTKAREYVSIDLAENVSLEMSARESWQGLFIFTW